MRFRGEYAFLSNFYEHPVWLDGIEFRCAEGAYQASKCAYDEDIQVLSNLNGKGAKAYGRTVETLSNWEERRVFNMADVLHAKFYDKALRKRLLAVEGEIVEENYWKDTFWGYDTNLQRGENVLGKLLMITRDYYRWLAALERASGARSYTKD